MPLTLTHTCMHASTPLMPWKDVAFGFIFATLHARESGSHVARSWSIPKASNIVNAFSVAVNIRVPFVPYAWGVAALHTLTRLGVFDLLDPSCEPSTAQSASQLAAAVQAHAAHLYRVLRVVAGAGYLQELPEERFVLTPAGTCLRVGGGTICP